MQRLALLIPKALLAHLGVADHCLLLLLLGGNDNDHSDDLNKETILKGKRRVAVDSLEGT
jgi:hypothetical protein